MLYALQLRYVLVSNPRRTYINEFHVEKLFRNNTLQIKGTSVLNNMEYLQIILQSTSRQHASGNILATPSPMKAGENQSTEL